MFAQQILDQTFLLKCKSMTTVKVFMYPRQNKDGTNPIRIRVTRKRKPRVITLFKIQPKFFNKDKGVVRKNHPKSDELNRKISNQLKVINDKILALDSSGFDYSVDDIFKSNTNRQKLSYYIQYHIDQLHDLQKDKASRKYQNLYDKIELFDADVDVEDVNKSFMSNFQIFLRNQEAINSEHTVARYLKFLKTILGIAQSQDHKIHNDAISFKISIPKSIRTKLTLDEIKSIEGFTDSKLGLTRDTFLLQFYLRGSRIGDILQLKHNNIRNGSFHITEQKTGKKKSIKLNEKMLHIIRKYHNKSIYGYILPWMDLEKPKAYDFQYLKRIESKTSLVNRDLKLIAAKLNIDKRLSSHIARHSYAYLCLKKGFDIGQIRDLLNHGDIKTTQTYIYQLAESDELDALNDKVLDY